MTEQIQDLLNTLKHGSRQDLWEAAKELSSITTGLALCLVKLLQDAERTDTRAAAAYVLGLGRFASARTTLEAVLDDTNEDPDVRGHAVEALAYIQAKESAAVVLKHLQDQNPGVLYWCIFALSQIGDFQAVPALKQLAEHVGDQLYDTYSLRAEALEAIAQINQRQEGAMANDDR